jgi:xylulokinase
MTVDRAGGAAGLVLACDLGSTNFRAALLGGDGAIAFAHTVRLATGDEVDPGLWWRLFVEATDALASQAGEHFDDIVAISICGVARTQVFLDANGQCLRPALTWRDARAAEWASRLAALAPKGWPETAHLNAFHPAARLAWLADAEPDCFARLHAVIDPKDYLNFRLTGVIATDVVSGARLWAASGLFAAAGLPGHLTAIPCLDPRSRLAPVQAGLTGALSRLAGRPVFAMANDTWATAAGMGALRAGLAYNISGTTEVFGAIGLEPVTAPGLLSVDWGTSIQQIGGPSQSGADALVWLEALLEGDIDTLLAKPRQPEPVLFLPFLLGERVPYWDPTLRAAFLGLNRRHTGADLVHAVLEGIAFLNRVVLERAEAALGARVDEIRFGGGGAKNALWCQMKADVTGRAILMGQAAEPGLLGGAIVAWTGLGAFPDIASAQAKLVRMARRYDPDPARHASYAPHFQVWQDAIAATRDIGARLGALG